MCASHGVVGNPKAQCKRRQPPVCLGRIPSLGVGALPARLSGGIHEAEQECTCWDPKDGKLCLSRTKSGETLMEVRNDSDVQIDRQT